MEPQEAKLPTPRIRPDLGIVNPPMIEIQLRDAGRVFSQVIAQSYADLEQYIQEAAQNVIQRFPWQQAIEAKLTEELKKMVDWEVTMAIGDGIVREMLRERIANFVKSEIEVWRKFQPEAKL